MNFVEVLKACESAGGDGKKQAIKDALSRLDARSRELCRFAQDPYITFGVKKFDAPMAASLTDEDVAFHCFIGTLEGLAARDLTGNAARDAATQCLTGFSREGQPYLSRVIDKDLKGGFSADTYNLVLLARGIHETGSAPSGQPQSFEETCKQVDRALKKGGYQQFESNPYFHELVPVFKVMLADKCEDAEEFEQRIAFPCWGETKLDGERTIAVVKAGGVVYYSRSGLIASHCDGLFDDDMQRLRTHLGCDFVLDGERYAGDFTETVNAKKDGNDEAKKNLRFHAFFLMPLEHWLAQSTDITAGQNRKFLESLLADVPCEKILLPAGRMVQDYDDMQAYCDEAIDVLKTEGLILKQLDVTYQWDRSHAWCKVKRFYDVDARFVSFYPGKKGTRLAGTVGGANCVAFLESGERVEFDVGSGFDDPERADMLANPDKWLALTHVISYQDITSTKGKQYRSLRFCTYKRSRDDKVVEV